MSNSHQALKLEIISYVRMHKLAAPNIDGILNNFVEHDAKLIRNLVYAMTGNELIKNSTGHYFVDNREVMGERFELPKIKRHQIHNGKVVDKRKLTPMGEYLRRRDDNFWKSKYTADVNNLGKVRTYRKCTDGVWRDAEGNVMEPIPSKTMV